MKSKLPEGWKEVKLGDVVDVNKFNYSKKDNWDFINYLDTGNITNNVINEIEYIDLKERNLPSRARRKVAKGDVIYSTVRPIQKHIGIIDSVMENMLVSTGFTVMTPITSRLNGYFLYSFLTLKDITIFLQSIAEQRVSTYPALNISDLTNLIIPLPPLKEQEAIANTLSILDDKIENNNKIAENLEAQAQAIFKHWFVDFEFPNEEEKPYKSSGGEMVESEIGMIPKGWDVGKLGDSKLGKLISSGIDDFKGEKIYLATADVINTNINNNQTLITMENKPIRANMQPKSNTVWFAKMKDSRKLIFVEKNDDVLKDNYIFSTGFAGIQGYETSVYYLWTYIQSDNFNNLKNSLCTGTTMQAINNRNINKIKLVIPDSKVLEKFNEIVIPLYKKNVSNRNENYILTELRDTLLPKLISGEIRLTQDFNGDAFDG